MTFQRGEHAVYPGCGVGVVDDIQTMDEGTEVYVLSFPGSKTRVWVPKRKAPDLGMRPVMTSQQLSAALKRIPSQPSPPKRLTWNRRFKVYDEKIKANTPDALAEVIGELAAIQREKPLSFGEKRIFRHAQSLLVREGALVRNTDEETFSSELCQMMERIPA